MPHSKTGIFTVSLLALALAGCQSGRFSSPAPAPLPPAPSGVISSTQLPPPTAPTDPSAFPAAPTGSDTQMAAVDPAAVENAPDVTAGSVAGVWNVTVAGQSCRVATPQTKYGQGYRAGPLRCPAPLDSVKSWSVEGKQLAFYNENGEVLARLYSSGSESFSGQTTTGTPISLSR